MLHICVHNHILFYYVCAHVWMGLYLIIEQITFGGFFSFSFHFLKFFMYFIYIGLAFINDYIIYMPCVRVNLAANAKEA